MILTIFISIVYCLNKGPSPFISLFWLIWNNIMSPNIHWAYISRICTKCCLYLTNISLSPIYHQNQGHMSVISIWEEPKNLDLPSYQNSLHFGLWTIWFSVLTPPEMEKRADAWTVDIVRCKFLELWKFWDCGRLFTYIFIKRFIFLKYCIKHWIFGPIKSSNWLFPQ